MRLPAIFRRRRTEEKALSPVPTSRGGWWSVLESYPGAWQSNVVVNRDAVLAYHAVYACMTLIASDIAKLRIKLVEQDATTGIWSEVRSPAFTPVLRKPNGYQTRIQFWESWILSKLITGNAYVFKRRDARGIVVELYVLDPRRVTPLMTEDGDVYYQLSADNISTLERDITVPAAEMIHDRFNCLFHPLVGTSPIFAAGVSATQGLRIQDNSATFFANQSRPGGMLSAPGHIPQETAVRLKETLDASYSGANVGKMLVAGDGLKFEPFAMTAEDSQLIEQLRWTADVVCSTFHVPPYKIGVGTMPTYNNIQALNVEYYSQCLQRLIEDAELCLDEGLGLEMPKDGRMLGTEFDLDGLLRMDTTAAVNAEKEAVGAGIKSPNEARRRFDLPPVAGGEGPYLQQQNYSLAALAKRDAQDDPFGSAAPEPAPAPAEPSPDDKAETERAIAALRMKFAGALYAA